MKGFLVIPAKDNKEQIAGIIEKVFTNKMSMEGGLWLVADPKITTATGIWNLINKDKSDEEIVGAVIEVDNRGGYYFRSFWETLKDWESK